MNIDVSTAVPGAKAKVTTEKSNLNIRKGPGTDQPIVGKAAHHSLVTLISKTNDQWWLIRNEKGEEGYVFAQYLTPEQTSFPEDIIPLMHHEIPWLHNKILRHCDK